MGGIVNSIFGGGGSSAQQTAPQSTTTTVQNTNIPTYAQPYVQNMLNATQSQLFQTDANGNITGFNQYTPYSGMNQQELQNAQQAVAGFSPLQQQAQSSAANLQMPGQYGQATGATQMGIMGALGTTNQAAQYGQQGNMYGQMGAGLSNMYGQQGNMAGQQAAGMSNMLGMNAVGQGQQGAAIGQSLAQLSTSPSALQAYMNPYIQNALNPSLQLLSQQTGIQSAAEQSAATSHGAFGGSREALQNSLVQQGGNLAAQQMIGTAYQTAANEGTAQMNAANQAALAGNAQAQTGFGQGLSAAQQAGQLGMAGSQLGLSGANQAASLGMQGAQAGLAGVGAQQAGYNQAMSGAGQLANIGNQQLAAQQGIIGTQAQQGALQQQNQQQVINQGIQNYATAQQYPLMELGTMSNMLRGLPMQSATTQQYQAAPSALTQAVGAAGVASQLAAKGGLLKTKKYAGGGILDATRDDLEAMPTDALQKEEGTTSSPTIKSQIKQILAMRAGAPMTAAGGGILAFADGDLAQTPPEVARGNALLANYNQQLADASKSKFNFGQSSQTPTDTSTPVSAPTQSGANDQAVAQAYIEAAQLQAAQNKAAQAAAPASAPVQNAVRGRGAPPIPQAPAGIMQAATPSAPTSTPGTILSGRGVPIQQDVSPRVAAARAYEAKQAAAQAAAQQDQTQQTPPTAAAPQAAPQGQPPQAAPQGQPPAQNPAAITAAAPQGQAPQAPKPQVDPHKAIEAHAQKDLTQKLNDPNVTNWAQLLLPGDDYIKAQLADKAAYVGPNNVESQVAALKDRQAREMKTADTRDKLVKAQMFAKMATTPGSFITAALTGVSSAIPGLIANADKRDEALNHIDDAIANVYKADRLEKSGDYDAAQKAREKVVENTINGYKAVWQAKSEMIKAQADMAKVGVESQKLGVDKQNANYLAAEKYVKDTEAVNEKMRTSKDYLQAKNDLSIWKNNTSDMGKEKYANAVKTVKETEDRIKANSERAQQVSYNLTPAQFRVGNAPGGSGNVTKLD